MKYEHPMIIKIEHDCFGKVGLSYEKKIALKKNIEECSIDDLIKKYGSPLFIFSKNDILEKIKKAKSAFSQYEKTQFSWSYKTNYLKSICEIFHKNDFLAEVVSEFEYEKARNLGIAGKNIIFNGPLKSEQILIKAIKEKAKIHIDNWEEFLTLKKLSEESKEIVNVGIRINLNSGIYPQWSRFGLNLESGMADFLIEEIMKAKYLNLSGIHTHIGTFILEPQFYYNAAKKMTDLFLYIDKKYNHQLDYIDMGGGIPSSSHLKGIYQSPDIYLKDVDEYAQKMTAPFKELPKSKRPQLILENGRHFIDEAGYLSTKVCNSKIMPDGKRSYVLDAGVNLLYTSTWYTFKLFSTKEIKGLSAPSILNGPLCMNIDIIDSNISLPFIPSESNLILHPVGAYNITQSMQFIQYRPAVILVDGDESKIIKKRETLKSVELDEVCNNK